MQEFRLAALSSKTDVGASCLIIQKVGAGGNLHVSAVGRHPNLDVVGACRGESKVAGGQSDHSVRDIENLQHRFRVLGQSFQLVPGILRLAEFHELYLVKLMLADQASGIAARGARLRAEAWRICRIVDRQVCLRYDLLRQQIGDRNLSGRDQEKVLLRHIEHVLFKLR